MKTCKFCRQLIKGKQCTCNESKMIMPEVKADGKSTITEIDLFWDLPHDIKTVSKICLVKLHSMRIDPSDGITYYTGHDIKTGVTYSFIEYADIINP
jgi:hypothetical protein